jgi:hypothetical protein
LRASIRQGRGCPSGPGFRACAVEGRVESRPERLSEAENLRVRNPMPPSGRRSGPRRASPRTAGVALTVTASLLPMSRDDQSQSSALVTKTRTRKTMTRAAINKTTMLAAMRSRPEGRPPGVDTAEGVGCSVELELHVEPDHHHEADDTTFRFARGLSPRCRTPAAPRGILERAGSFCSSPLRTIRAVFHLLGL